MIRDAIRTELARLNRPAVWLAEKSGVHVNVIYRYLAGGVALSSTVDKLVAALGLIVGPPKEERLTLKVVGHAGTAITGELEGSRGDAIAGTVHDDDRGSA